MKRSLFSKSLKSSLLAVPAAVLMLGSAHGGSTVGLNFQAWYYDSGATPQTIGFGYGYQTTGFPVTAKAFGVEVADWTNTDPLDCQAAVATTLPFGGSLSASINAANMWQSGWTGPGLYAPWIPGPQVMAMMQPGDYQVTWGYLDNTGWSVDATGLAAKFPDGYVIALIGSSKTTDTSSVALTNNADGSSLGAVTFRLLPDGMGLGISPALTNDSVNLSNPTRPDAANCALGGFILTDKPVVMTKPVGGVYNYGDSFNLTAANVIGLGTITYQWQHAGTNLPGATSLSLSVTNATTAEAGDYVLVATSSYGSGNSSAATIRIRTVPEIATDLYAGTNTLYQGLSKEFSVTAVGPATMTYQWSKNGSPIPGATGSSYTLMSVTSADVAGYSVAIGNGFGSTNSATNWIAVVAAPDPLYVSQIGLDVPLAYWPLNELATETNTFDHAQNGANGYQTGTLLAGEPGPQPPAFAGFNASKTAYRFDGSSAGVVLGNKASLSGTTDFTVEAWISPYSPADGVIIQQRNGGYDGEYRFMLNSSGGLSFMVYGGGDYQFDFSTTRVVVDGNWHHVAAVRSGANGYIYIDGQLAASASGTLRPLDGTIGMFIGYDGRSKGSYFNGWISDVAVYSHTVTETALKNHYFMGKYGSVTAVPPSIVASPASISAFATLSAGFSANADGTPLAYQWFKNDSIPIAGATTDTLVLTNVAMADNNSTYKLVVSNAQGTATSEAATLTVVAGPPYEGFAYPDGDPVGRSGGTGWADAWAYSSTGTGSNVVANPGANYRDSVNELAATGGKLAMGGNEAGGTADMMDDRTLSTYVGPYGTVYISFIGQFINSGWEGIDLYEDATYQMFLGQGWYFGNWACGSFPYPEISTTKASTAYSFVVYRFDMTPTGTQVKIYVDPTIGAGEPETANATGSWSGFRFNRVRVKAHALSSGVLDELRIAGSWAGAFPSRTRTDAPVILTQPIAQTLFPGGTAHFNVSADGAPPVHYVWMKGSTTVGTDSPALTIPNVGAGDVASYSVTVNNAFGSVPSASVPLSLLDSPTGFAAIVTSMVPVAYWQLNETNGPTAADVWGGHDATYNGGITYSVAGPLESTGVTLDGLAGTKIVAPYSADLNPSGPFTVECWINPLDLTAGNRVLVQSMVNGDPGANSNDRSGWCLRQNGATLQFLIGNNSTTTAGYSTTATTPAVLTAGVWQHVVAVYNSANTNVTVWLDGTNVLSVTGTKMLFPNFAAPTIIGDRGFGGWRYNGSISQVALYPRALSELEIQSLAQNRPLITITQTTGGITLTWPAGTLQAAPEATGTYTNVPSAASPWPVTPNQARTFYRLAP